MVQILLCNNTNSIKYQSFMCPISNVSIWPIDGTLSGTTTPVQNGPGSNGNIGVLRIPESAWSEASPSDCMVTYTRLLSGGWGYPPAEMQLAYPTDTADWANKLFVSYFCIELIIKKKRWYSVKKINQPNLVLSQLCYSIFLRLQP